MTLGFKSRNHPQQIAVNGADDAVDDRMTPLWLWTPLDMQHGFTLDAAASEDNRLCEHFFTREQNGLEQSWAYERVWVNPPFSAMRAWVEKAWHEVGNKCPLVVMLAPANRTEQRWWQESIEPYRDGREHDRKAALTTLFLPRRINFASPDNLGAYYSSSAPFGCVLLTWRAVAALPGAAE